MHDRGIGNCGGALDYHNEIVLCEITDWWEGERVRVQTECNAMLAWLLLNANELIENLTDPDLMLPFSSRRSKIRKQIAADVDGFNRRIAATLQESADVSMERLEGSLEHVEPSLLDSASFFGGGAVSVGSLGVAASTKTIATTTSARFRFLAPVVSVVVLAATGPWRMSGGRRRARTRIQDRIEGWLRTQIVDLSNDASTLSVMRSHIDRIAKTRMEAVQ